jgi:hypothetical protein
MLVQIEVLLMLLMASPSS